MLRGEWSKEKEMSKFVTLGFCVFFAAIAAVTFAAGGAAAMVNDPVLSLGIFGAVGAVGLAAAGHTLAVQVREDAGVVLDDTCAYYSRWIKTLRERVTVLEDRLREHNLPIE